MMPSSITGVRDAEGKSSVGSKRKAERLTELREDKEALDRKTGELSSSICSSIGYKHLDDHEKILMHRQLSRMMDLSAVLSERIAHLEQL